jgi:hypothetical protein
VQAHQVFGVEGFGQGRLTKQKKQGGEGAKAQFHCNIP